MSWHCSLALVEEFSVRGCLDGESSARLRSSRIAEKSFYGDKRKASSKRSRFGMTCGPLTASRGVELWMLSQAASPASPSPLPGSARARWTSEISGLTPFALYEKSGPDGAYWKTSQGYFIPGISGLSSADWPKAGMMLAGRLYRRGSWARRIGEIGCGLWPTVKACRDGYRGKTLQNALDGKSEMSLDRIIHLPQMWPTPRGNKTTSEKAEVWQERRNRGDVSTLSLALAVALHGGAQTRPTPAARNV